MLTETDSEKYFFLTVQPPERYTPDDIPPREYIFVLDVSGSMYGYPLDTAKDLIRSLATGLRDMDRFNLVLFSDDTYLLSTKSLAANSRNVQAAIDLIDEQEGGGGTSMLPALQTAVSVPMKEVTCTSHSLLIDSIHMLIIYPSILGIMKYNALVGGGKEVPGGPMPRCPLRNNTRQQIWYKGGRERSERLEKR